MAEEAKARSMKEEEEDQQQKRQRLFTELANMPPEDIAEAQRMLGSAIPGEPPAGTAAAESAAHKQQEREMHQEQQKQQQQQQQQPHKAGEERSMDDDAETAGGAVAKGAGSKRRQQRQIAALQRKEKAQDKRLDELEVKMTDGTITVATVPGQTNHAYSEMAAWMDEFLGQRISRAKSCLK